jgi:hypothetical protein
MICAAYFGKMEGNRLFRNSAHVSFYAARKVRVFASLALE